MVALGGGAGDGLLHPAVPRVVGVVVSVGSIVVCGEAAARSEAIAKSTYRTSPVTRALSSDLIPAACYPVT